MDEPRIDRRRALGLVLRTAGLAAGARVAGLVGCASGPPPLRLSASEFPDGARVRVVWADRPIEVVRRGASVTARSLRCTHQGCEVRWEARGSRYVCPCHGGVFDARGKPIAGPPKLALASIAAHVDGEEVVVGRSG